MSPVIEKIENFKINIDENRILRLIGYKKKSNSIHEPLRNLIADEKNKCDDLLQPASIYTIIEYGQTNKHPIFKDAEKVAFCICTIGPKLEKEVKNLTNNNDILKAMILDSHGSEAVEEVAIQSDQILAKKARDMNLWASKRYSPGYGRWDLREQKYVFHILPGQDIAVSLNKSCMMIPQKSISFRINFYKEKDLSTRK